MKDKIRKILQLEGWELDEDSTEASGIVQQLLWQEDQIRKLLYDFSEEIIGEDEDKKEWTPENQTMEYEEVVDIGTRNELRKEQRALRNKLLGK